MASDQQEITLRRFTYLLLLLLSVSASATDQYSDYLVRVYKPDEPGATVIVVKSGEILQRSAHGMANLELNVPMQVDSVLRIGSLTKQFTAAAVLMLEAEGKLQLDDKLTKYFPDYPTHGHEITLHHLLTHTSGIASYTDIKGYTGNPIRRDLDIEELILVFKYLPMEFAPGTRFQYNNSGYVLLGAIIEQVSGMDYEDFITSRIFEPLQMTRSYYGGPQLIPGRAAGYERTEEGYKNAAYISMTQPHGAGSLLSTVTDLALWNQALFLGNVINKRALQLMTTPAHLNDDTPIPYGYGLSIIEVQGREALAHSGGINGFSAYSVYIPGEDVFVAVLQNNPISLPNTVTVATRLAGMAIGDPYPFRQKIELPASTLQKVLGTYRINDSATREIVLEDGDLYTIRSNGLKFLIYPDSHRSFFYPYSLTWFEMEFGEDGDASAMLMYHNGARSAVRAEKVPEGLTDQSTEED